MKIGKFFRKIKKRFYLKNFDGIHIKQVDEVAINPVLRCNLNCVMCHQGEIKCRKDMTFDKFEKILKNLKKEGVTKVSLIGGEIFVMQDIWKFIGLMEKMGFRYDLSTNLFNVPDLDKFSKLKGLEMVTTSLDGTMEIHNKIRRNPRAFQNATTNIQRLVKMKIPVDVACVVQKANLDSLEELTQLVCRLGVKSMTFLAANKITPKDREVAIKEMEGLSGGKANFYVSTIANPLGDLTVEDYKKIPGKVATIKKIAHKYGVKVSFATQLEDLRVLDKKTPLLNYTCSLFNGYGPYVYEDGVLNTCAFTKLDGEKFDLSKHTPLEILNSPEYQKIRGRFKKAGAPEMCRFCCALRKK
jgi:MoaA/NifB/PqqE/SkfB family radical SAM enzyme